MKTFSKIVIIIMVFGSLIFTTSFYIFSQNIYWTEINSGLGTSTEFDDIQVSFADHVFACSWYGEGLFRSMNNGNSWLLLNNGLPDVIKTGKVAISNNGTVFFGGKSGVLGTGQYDYGIGIYRSLDNGNTWMQMSLEHGITEAIAINQNGAIFVGLMATPQYYNLRGIHRSTDNGNTWIQVANNNTIFYVTELAINSNGDIYVGTYQDGLYRSTNNGNSWTLLNSGLQGIFTIEFNSSGDIFVGTLGDGIFRSTNNGSSWSMINNGLSGLYVTGIVINSNDEIFIGVFGEGVFMSGNNGNTWSEVNNGLTNFNVWDLTINSQGQLFAATDYGGIFRSSSTITNVNDIIKNQQPNIEVTINRYNNIATLRYTIYNTSTVIIKIYNQNGTVVKMLINQVLEPGIYHVDFDISSLSSGLYLCNMICGGLSSARIMIVVK